MVVALLDHFVRAINYAQTPTEYKNTCMPVSPLAVRPIAIQ